MNLDRFGPAPDDDGPWECEDCAEPVRPGERFCWFCDEERRQRIADERAKEEEGT